jgi:large subunit ribosomal protein L22
MKAYLKNYRQAPRKVRLVANLIKGKQVDVAMLELKHLAKRAALPMEKLLASAVANAKVAGADVELLMVKDVTVDKGIVLKRHMPRAFGRASAIHKHASHVTLTLSEKGAKAVKAAKAEKKESTPVEKAKPVKKVAAKKPTKAKAVKE